MSDFLTFGADIDNLVIMIFMIGIAAGILSHFKISGVAPILIFSGVLIMLAGSLHLVTEVVYALGFIFFGIGVTMVVYHPSQSTESVEEVVE